MEHCLWSVCRALEAQYVLGWVHFEVRKCDAAYGSRPSVRSGALEALCAPSSSSPSHVASVEINAERREGNKIISSTMILLI